MHGVLSLQTKKEIYFKTMKKRAACSTSAASPARPQGGEVHDIIREGCVAFCVCVMIQILKSTVDVRVRCKHSALNGNDTKTSTVYANQRRDTCAGNALPDFYWPRELEREYSPRDPILLYRNDLFADDHPRDSRLCWRKTKQDLIFEVPFWKVLCDGIREGWLKD